MNTFISRLGPVITDFLDFKHALGIKYTSASVYLRELDRYNASHGDHSTCHRFASSADTLLIPEILAHMYWIIRSSFSDIARMST